MMYVTNMQKNIIFVLMVVRADYICLMEGNVRFPIGVPL